VPQATDPKAMPLPTTPRELWAFLTERKERVRFWLGLLLTFVPVFWFLLFFKRYSWLARIGWGLWLGFIVFVKVFGLSEPILQIHSPGQMPVASFGPTSEDLPIGTYVGKLLGAQYLDSYAIDGGTITLKFLERDTYFNNREILADLAISDGFSLLFRRDFQAVRMEMIHEGKPLTIAMNRADFLSFFGITEADVKSYSDRDKLRASPVFNVTVPRKLEFIRQFAGLP
jgi:hypothetical protein